jgi:hypothetical protein
MLTKEQILAVEDSRFEVVSVPEWGGEVCVGVMTGEERDAFEAACYSSRNGQAFTPSIRARVCSWTIRGEDGQRLFGPDDIATLGRKSGVALERVYVVAERVNGLTKSSMDELEKNSKSGQSA